ncbi:NUDIX domain-containing protein [Anaerocolumna sedimenticola]|uniref:NUDIX domain-containing protein n=1 Tax=Anaerocolumna sedimenticola TaxID=2696063 RepID=A0A6P1TT07_9FIRM|nr:NUDIX hydrolase [Anaerocolumna sedimenticola]QHQ63517.1 NUDIX domain-containing protein [Anaerocolumna sedimenticola]
MKNNFYKQIKQYNPWNEQEENDRKIILKYVDLFDNIFTRENEIAHITGSSWIVNQDRSKVLMIYHNIYDSWAWTGGHADGETDLISVALREAKEETGIINIKPVLTDIYSLEILCVNGHVKREKYVSSHLHLNITYLLEADDSEMLRIKADENSGVKWVDRKDAVNLSNEVWMRGIYSKLNEKLDNLVYESLI